jgi:threonine synthase
MARTSGRKNGAQFYELHCISCDKRVKEAESSTRCPACHSPLNVVYDYDYIRSRLNRYSLRTSPVKALKYLDFYPLLDLVVSMNEGGTSLYRCTRLAERIGLRHLYIKNEGANPTGVFKDRGSLVELTKAKEQGAKAVCVASTGNMAASVAAYTSVAGLPCYVLVPEGTAIGKMAQALSYGARVIQVRGTYSDAASPRRRATATDSISPAITPSGSKGRSLRPSKSSSSSTGRRPPRSSSPWAVGPTWRPCGRASRNSTTWDSLTGCRG